MKTRPIAATRLKIYQNNLAKTALFLAMSLVVGTIEHMLPPLIPALPFARLGLSNVVVLFVLVALGIPEALTVSVIKSLLVPLFVGNPMMILFALPSSLLASTVSAWLVRRCRFSLAATGMVSALVHNTVQLFVGALTTGTFYVFSFFPYLLVLGTLAGGVTGFLVHLLLKSLPRQLFSIKG